MNPLTRRARMRNQAGFYWLDFLILCAFAVGLAAWLAAWSLTQW